MKIRSLKEFPGIVWSCDACKKVNHGWACVKRKFWNLNRCTIELNPNEFPDFTDEE